MSLVAQRLRASAPPTSGVVRDQLAVACGQMAAGVGNMAFSLAAARVLDPGAFGQLAAFLALYVLLGVPSTSISAATALSPERTARLRPLVRSGGVALGLLIAVCSPFLAELFRLPIAMVVVLGLSCPALGPLALERGRLYGNRTHRALVTSLLTEPAIRLLLGVGLAALGGAVGAALAVGGGGFAALEVARTAATAPRRDRGGGDLAGVNVGVPAVAAEPPAPLLAASWPMAGFLFLAVVQNQDLLIANRLLSASQAGQFAVLSTLGGMSVFATMTAPLVLLPRLAHERRAGVGSALLVTGAIGVGLVAVVGIAPHALVALLFGARYAPVGAELVPYVAAMGLLGVLRVVVAHRCTAGRARSTLVLCALAIGLQAGLICTFADGARAVAYSTVSAVGALTVSLGTAEIMRLPVTRARVASLRIALREPVPRALAVAGVLGFTLRMIVPRGLWLDEATSVYQARMGYAAMLHNLRTTDVHPPLYFSVLWVVVHLFGDGALVVRIPSIIAGWLIIPMLYLVGREAYDRRTGAVAALLGSVAPILVWYSQEARMYSMLALFGAVAIWAQIRLIRNGGGRSAWMIYTLATVALAWTQYFGLWQVAVQQIVFVHWLWSRWRRGEDVRAVIWSWAASALVIAAALIALAPFAYDQFVVNQTAGKGFGAPSQTVSATSISGNHLTIYSAVANLIWAVWGYQPNTAMLLVAALWPLGMLFALVLLGRRHQPATSMLVAAVVVPGVGMYVLGLAKQNLFDIRYLSTTVPILFVLVARVLSGIPRRSGVVIATTALFSLTLIAGLINQQYNGSNPRTYDFSGALAAVERVARPGDVVYYEPSDLREVVLYYAPGLRIVAFGGDISPPSDGRRVFVIASRSLMTSTTDVPTLADGLATLRKHDGLIATHTYPNVETWEFR